METPEFIAPDLWPPNSPHLNPVDYQVWGLMQERVYKTPVNDTTDLKQRLIEAWSGITQAVFDKAIDQWTVRLRACVKVGGRHFEHLLTTSFQSYRRYPTGSFQNHPKLTEENALRKVFAYRKHVGVLEN